MPILPSQYEPEFWFKNPHFATIYPNLFRKVDGLEQQRYRLELEDQDFMDLDISFTATGQSRQVVIILHGLEGNAQRPYMKGLAQSFITSGKDVIAVNLRSCSGSQNRLYASYHAGASNDLAQIVDHTIKKGYENIILAGFSLGGNIILKYLGEERSVPSEIKCAVTFSVPCHLYDSLQTINKMSNYIYRYRFIKSLKTKLLERQRKFPEQLTVNDVLQCKTLIDIDNLYTSRAHGFSNAFDYYEKCSSIHYINQIKIPTLLLSSKDDTFLGNDCYPIEIASEQPYFYLEITNYGGHVGFYNAHQYYSECRALEFVSDHL